ncbi:MAG: hypothetical protein EOP09_04570 [Proteobacteria bacterium]|nr:MAG: hypothetical protein EOP09_04570 [Pseudomonadota bacterium]
MGDVKATKSTIGVRIQPGLDRYYYIGIIDDPAGVVERENVATTGTGGVTNTTQVKTFYNKTKFSAMFAKNFYDFTVRGGLIENQGGMGMDYVMLRRRLKLSMEAFNFSSTNVRAQAMYSLTHGFYVLGGVQDMLNNSDVRSSYLGAGLYITNDDLKVLLSSKSPF